MSRAEEIKKCADSPAYFYNTYCKIVDKNGNEIPKPHLTDKQFTTAMQHKRNKNRKTSCRNTTNLRQ